MNRNCYREEKPCFCCFHPTQIVVGVCPLCLNERLLIVAAKQGHHRHRHSSSASKSKSSSHNNRVQSSNFHRKTPTSSSSSSIHKIFAFGNSLFTRPDSYHQQWKSEINNYEYDVSPSPEEESFISIKFEENGVASWEKSKVSNKSNKNKVSLENRNGMSSWKHSKETKSVVEHGKSRDVLRWRKRIGHMLQLIRWKRTGGVCHVGSSKVEGVKVRKGKGSGSSGGWMRTLTKRNKTVE